MTATNRPHTEQRPGWAEFINAMQADSDPVAVQLMDDFRRVAHQIYQLSESSLEAAGLSYAQFRVLMGLSYCEWTGSFDGQNPSEISAQQGTSRNTISALIRSLEHEGLIERHLDREDRRRFNIQLTEAGREVVRQHASRHGQFISDLFAALGDDERKALDTLLQMLERRTLALKDSISQPSQR